jgi:hypothetical protein
MEFLLLAQLAQPVPRISSCPIGYYTQAGYCVPAAGAAREAIIRVENSCPFGWYTQGSYCQKLGTR